MDRLTYCNPLPLPDYPAGMFKNRRDLAANWRGDRSQDYRETGDPTVLFYEGAWYLFPSCGMIWRTEDFVNWTYHPNGPRKIGYAPTVVQYRGNFLLTAMTQQVWKARHPLGPWEELGIVKLKDGTPTKWWDPMLFVDDDGALYGYYFLGEKNTGVYGVRLADDDPTKFARDPVHCFGYDPSHTWERYGDQNQNPWESWIEGPWMSNFNGKYYLQYSGCGTQWKGYAVGCYVSEGPLGPFYYQKRNPILRHANGLINGCGHHSLVEGPNRTLWCFYTVLVRIEHDFERRIGMDPAGFDSDGNLFISGPTEVPQLAPGVLEHPELGNDGGCVNLSAGQPTTASSSAIGYPPSNATDNQIRTWWEADEPGPAWLQVELSPDAADDVGPDPHAFFVSSARTMFADRGLDYEKGVLPGPYQYRIDGYLANEWSTLCDQSRNCLDKHIAYDTWEPVRASKVRLVILAAPVGLRIGVWEFTVFGFCDF